MNKYMENLKIGTRLGVGFTIVVLLTVLLGGFALLQISTIFEKTQKLYVHPLQVSNAALEANSNIIAMHRSMKDVALAKNDADIERVTRLVDGYEKDVISQFDIIRDRFLGDKSQVNEALQIFLDWKKIRERVITNRRAGNIDEAIRITKEQGADHVEKMNAQMKGLIDFAKAKSVTFMKGATATKDSAQIWTIIAIISVVLLSGLIAFAISRSITTPISQLGGFMEMLSSGNNDIDITLTDRGDEVGVMAEAVEVFRQGALERVRLEQKSREANQKRDILAEIINLSADAVISLDGNHNIVLVNAAFEKIFGYSEGEILGQPLNLLLPKTVRSNHKKLIATYDKSGEDSRYMGQRAELYGISKSGDEIPLDIAIQKHPEGSFCLYTAVCRDISHRLEQEKMVRENEAKFRMLFDTSHHITILMKGDGEVVEFNDTVRRLLSTEAVKNIGRKVWDCEFWASEADYSLIEVAVSKIKPGDNISLIVNALGENNQKIILEISLKIIWTDYKHSTLIVLEGKDITEIRRSNKALVESEGRLARAQKMARLGNFEWGLASNEVIWSNEVYEIFGLSPDKFCPDYESFLERVHPDDRDIVDSSVISALKSDRIYQLVHRILLPDGSEKIIEAIGEIFRMDDGTPTRIEGTMQDITVNWNREQELLRAKRQAEEANIAKAQFLSTVSHELRTPLNAIIGFGSMIAEEQLGKINIPSYRDYAVDISTSGKELLKLIENILNVTSYELGSIKYQPCYLSAQTLLDKTMPYMVNRAAEKNISIETCIGSDIPELYIDLEHTRQILVHLVDNAIKFSGENDTVKVNFYYKKNEFVIDVIDQGIGLEDADKEIIFDLFVQKDMNLSRAYGGVGLGLTIVKNLVEIQGGRIRVESNVDQGSCFSVYFPNVEMAAALTAG